MQNPHFESNLRVLLKVSGHVCANPIYMLEPYSSVFGYFCIEKKYFRPSTHSGDIGLL